MTQIKIEPDRIISNFLRLRVTDINTTRSGAGNPFVFPDYPRIKNIGDSDWPRVGVTLLSESADPLGVNDDDQLDTLTFQIDVMTKKGITFNVTTTDEAVGIVASTINTDRITLETVPNTITNIKHAGSAFGTLTAKDTDADFTAPGSLAAGTVEWSRSTGNLNFSAADVASYDTQAITSTYVVFMEGKKCVQYISREIAKAMRSDWRTYLVGLFDPRKINNIPQALDEDLGLYRQTMEYQCKMFNAGEGI